MKKNQWIMVSLSLSVCAALAHGDGATVPPSDIGSTAFIIISTFADAKSISSASTVVIRRADNHREVKKLQIDNFAEKPDFSPGWGFLYGLQVPPGEYTLELGSMNPYRHFKHASQELRFTVLAGSRTYLGEAYYSLHRDNGRLYGEIQMVDKADRDIPLFLSRNPGYPADMIVSAVPNKGA